MIERIDFFKNRSIGERFSVSIDFLKQNWKVLYKNILFGGLPLAIILGFFLSAQPRAQSTFGAFGTIIFMFFYFFVSFVNMIYIYSMTGAVLIHYDRNQLTENTGWNDLKYIFFKLARKTTLISIITYLPLFVLIGIIAILFFLSATAFSGNNMQAISFLLLFLFFSLLIGAFIAILPSLAILNFPAYFSGKTVKQSIKISFKLGFRNWGSLFVAIILTGIIFMVAYMVFNLPLQVITLFSQGNITLVSYIFATLSAIGTMIFTPITVVIFAFQYFSIVEKEEGISLQSQLNEFENL